MAVQDKSISCVLYIWSQQEQIMETNSGVNTAQDDQLRAEIYPDMQTVGYQRDLPPPYSVKNEQLHTVVSEQPRTIIRETIIIQPRLEDFPTLYPCPKCCKRVMTKVSHVNTKKTHLLAGFVFGCTCWCLLCCLAFIPYFVPMFKKVEHHCSECDTFLGDYSKF